MIAKYSIGMCPLHMAAWSGKDKIVKTLLENRALVNLPSFGGETPLLLASQHGHGSVVSINVDFELHQKWNDFVLIYPFMSRM